jgi:hypothetical protein
MIIINKIRFRTFKIKLIEQQKIILKKPKFDIVYAKKKLSTFKTKSLK